MRIKHAKTKNTGILFELLVRRITTDTLNNISDGFAVRIIREHFHPKSELGKELQLYRTFFNSPELSEAKALNLLDVVLARRNSLNESLLATQKYNLIRDIKKHCELKEFMNGRVPSYKVYASIYKLFESASDNIFTIDDVLTSRFLVVEHLQGKLKEEQIIKENAYETTLRDQDDEIRFLSYRFLLERFNEKYSVFNVRQKNLLREYINKGTNVEPFKQYIASEASTLHTEINSLTHKISDDVTKIKLQEVLIQLDVIKTQPTIKDNNITALLIAHQLVDELTALP
jgi:hypothetical protein